MTSDAWASLKVSVCAGSSIVSGMLAAIIADVSQSATQWVPVFVVGIITAATPGFLAWLQTRKIHTMVNSERTTMLNRLEAYHKEVVSLTASKSASDQNLKANVEASNLIAAKALGAAEEKAKTP
jgi:hypothetical protein